MSEWVNCTGINGASILVNLENVLTINNYGTGTRLALSGNSQTYVDVAEAPAEVLALPRIGTQFAPIRMIKSKISAKHQTHDVPALASIRAMRIGTNNVNGIQSFCCGCRKLSQKSYLHW